MSKELTSGNSCDKQISPETVCRKAKTARKSRRKSSNSGQSYGSLEPRRLLAIDVSVFQNGTLSIEGSDSRDNIVLRETTTTVDVYDNGRINEKVQKSRLNRSRRFILNGNGGNDTIRNLTSYQSTMKGGAGNDWLVGGSNIDNIEGGAGNDRIEGDFANDSVQFGNDWLKGGPGTDTIFGKSGNDTIDGGILGRFFTAAERDNLFGGAGNDRIFGRGGNDYILGNDGNDRIFGENGNDVIDGGFGNDHLYGGNGNDFLDPRAGNDRVFGNHGADVLISRGNLSGSNRLAGGTHNDRYRFIGNGSAGGSDTIVEEQPEGNFDRLELSEATSTSSVNLAARTIFTWGDRSQRTVTQNPTGNIEAIVRPFTAAISSGGVPTVSNLSGINVQESTGRVSNLSASVTYQDPQSNALRIRRVVLRSVDIPTQRVKELSPTRVAVSFSDAIFTGAIPANANITNVKVTSITFFAGAFVDQFGNKSPTIRVN